MAELYPRLWFRRFRPAAPDAQLLLCLPHAGGVAGTFHELSTHLAPKVDVLSVQYPGRQDRLDEAPFQDLRQLAQAIVAALPQHLPRSVSLFGHSYGALLAFEIAQHLLLRDDTVDRVFLSAHGPQFAPRTNPIYPLPQDAFIAAIRSFAGPTADLLLDPMIAELSLPSLIGDLTAAETHAMNKDVHAKLCISALYGTDDPRAMMQDLERWKDFAVRGNTAHFDLQSFEGGHLFLLEKSQEVARYILKQLSAVQTENDAPNVALID